MLKMGRFNNQSEVIREALRRMEREETSYLNPPPAPLTPEQVEQVYGPNPEAEAREVELAVAAMRSIRKGVRAQQIPPSSAHGIRSELL